MTTPSQTINQLRALTQIDIQSNWHYSTQDLSPKEIKTDILTNWQKVELNPKGYIIWEKGSKLIWLGQKIIVPENLQGYPLSGLALKLALTWWAADAEIFVNGELVQEGDLFDSSARVLLNSAVTPGAEIIVLLRLVSPGHDIGGLMRSLCVYEVNSESIDKSTNLVDPGFVADELEILHIYIDVFAPEKLDILESAIAKINWDLVSDKAQFDKSLSILRQNLLSQLPHPQSTINLLGHAHLDMAWLWQVAETWAVAERTFESVLKLQTEYPDLTFCHSTPALYAWIEENRPNLFGRIKEKVALGKWEIVGGMWVEPELNLIDGESIVRQILYAQHYVKAKFGNFTKIAWLPDSFGFTWQLPQLLKQGGIEYFVTQKLHWNDTTKFPHGIFWWQSPDGSKILSLMSPPNTAGVMDTNPITMGKYAIDWEKQTGLQDTLWLPGVGDHGGGPTRDMLEIAKRWQNSPFFPKLEFTTAIAFLDKIHQGQEESKLREKPLDINILDKRQRLSPKGFTPTKTILPFPRWNDELYLEFHRGCYTTHADQKYWNRRCEGLLYQAELFASLADIAPRAYVQIPKSGVGAKHLGDQLSAKPKVSCPNPSPFESFKTLSSAHYPKIELEAAWKKVLFNQFHDILPGTSIGDVFVEANRAWLEVEAVCLELLENSITAIASQISLPTPPHPNAKPIFIFNCLNWARSQVVSLPLSSIAIYFTAESHPQMEVLPDESINPTKIPHSQIGKSPDIEIFTNSEFPPKDTSHGKSPSHPSYPSRFSYTYIDGRELPQNSGNLSQSGKITEKKSINCPIWQIYDTSGAMLPSQQTTDSLLFFAESVPGVGYQLFWLVKGEAENLAVIGSESEKYFLGAQLSHYDSSISRFLQSDTIAEKDWVLENNFIRVIVDEETGNLRSIFDQVNEREILAKGGGGNELQGFEDSGQYWDAWNIDPNYEGKRLPPTELVSIEWMERGELRSRLRVIRKLGKSEFCQDYILEWESPLLKIATRVDWQEEHVLVKAAFPLNIEADFATYEIPCGAIARSTKLETPAQQAKWEVSALRWADLSEFPTRSGLEDDQILGLAHPHTPHPTPHTLHPTYGVSLLNDCKYGYDAKNYQLRLTLLRSPTWPDEDCDRGIHQFTYAIYPHSGTWQSAHTVRQGYELNFPCQIIVGQASCLSTEEREVGAKISSHLLPSTASLLNLEAENLILMAFKQKEDNPQEWILRCYECHGETAQLSLKSDLGLRVVERVDLLERSQNLPDDQLLQIAPWQVASFVVRSGLED